jgi:fructosamine-3-kinase
MTNPATWTAIAQRIAAATECPFAIARQQSLGGGAANSSHRIEGNGQAYFVKLGNLAAADRFATEGLALREIGNTQTIRVPAAISWGSLNATSYLVMEYLELGRAAPGGPEALGQQLAALHRHTAPQYGWEHDNTIGASLQLNGWSDDWVEFFREQRLKFQLQLARRNGYSGSWLQDAERLLDRLPAFFSHYQPQPSILHGDLWSGNYGYDREGNPTIFDPAFYYGDREADLAMTELFGGFPPQFYRSYDAAYPLDSGYAQRKILYNLYHLLNHLNIFGSGYMGQVQQAIAQSLAFC